MEQNNLDFLTWSRALKSAPDKGLERLRSMLQTDGQAQAFAKNSGAVAVVLGLPDDADVHSKALYDLLAGSAYFDTAM